jgi:hypothetical protein
VFRNRRSVTIGRVPDRAAAMMTNPGEHICAFYRGESEREEVIVPFLRDGLVARNRCVCVIPRSGASSVLAALGQADLDASMIPGLLDMVDTRDVYLSTGTFVAQRSLDYWDRWCGEALGDDGGAGPVRTVSDMSWFERRFVESLDDLMRYEACAGAMTAKYPVTSLCLYDLDRFGGDVVVPVLRTHHKVFFSNMLIENPYWIEPDQT